MKTTYKRFVVLSVMVLSFVLSSSVPYPQENQQMPKDQTAISKDQIQITTSSQQARDKYIQALNYLNNIQLEEAKPLLQDAIKLDPNFALAYMGLALAGGGFNVQKQNFDKAESLMNNVSDGEKHLISFYKAQFEGDIPKQKDEAQQLISMFPKDKEVQMLAGTLEQFTNRNYDAALQHYQEAVNIDPNFAAAYNLMGYIYSAKNDFNKAEEAFKKYISLMPNSPNPYDSYAELLLKNGRYDASIEQYQKALNIDPKFISSLEGIGNNYLFKGDFAKAREQYQSAFDKAPTTAFKLNALYDQAVSYVREGDINSALSTLDKRASLAESENSIPAVVNSHRMEGFILAESGKPDEAVKHFDMASEKIEGSSLPDKLKDNLMSQVKLDKLYGMVSAGKLDAASSELENKNQVIGSSENPENEKRYEAVMGQLALKQNKYDEALDHLSKGDTENPINWYYTAVAYQKKGDSQKATQLIDKIKQYNVNSLELALANNHAKETVAQTK